VLDNFLIQEKPVFGCAESKIQHHKIRITEHADEEAESDRLMFEEIFFSVFNGEIIEYYPEDKPYQSCLIYGNTFGGDPVHSVWAFNENNQWAVLITVYRPDPDRWVDFRQRREK
jgi:hypothetical protein